MLAVLAPFLFVACADVDEHTVRVLMATGEGDIEIELYPDRAPVTAGNFLKLVDGGHLDGGSFYRVVTYENDNGNPKIEVIQGGLNAPIPVVRIMSATTSNGTTVIEEAEPQPVDSAQPFETIAHETTEQTGILHEDGVISMARGDVGTANTEFFICIGDQPGLDYGNTRNPDQQGFAAFGRVVSGMDVVKRINGLPADAPSDSEYTKGQILTEPVPILSVRRID